MKLLALDTSTEACSAALWLDGELHQQYQMAPREHTQLLLAQVQILLESSDIKINQLDALAFGRGPGSFTGVRIATAVVQGMAYGADLPVVPVSTLASIAQVLADQHQVKKVISMIDARMGGVYHGQYVLDDSGLMRLQHEEAVLAPDVVPLPEVAGWVGAGTGWSGHGEVLRPRFAAVVSRIEPDVWPQAETIARLAVADFALGKAVSAEQAQPVYLRDDVAKKTWER